MNVNKVKYPNIDSEIIQQAAITISQANSLIITAGAGIGVDSGLPDFRGSEGFWNAYPAWDNKDLDFSEIASPIAFKNTPELAWGFYGYRLNLYRETIPHVGFEILKSIASAMNNNYFVYTSNVDGQFQKAGFNPEKIVEIHGSILHLQCVKPCKEIILSTQDFHPKTNNKECLLISDLPRCNNCGELLRPNILMFDDWHWIARNTKNQKTVYRKWLSHLNNNNRVIIELGAGTAIPSIRNHSEKIKGTLIRINPRESNVNPKTNDIAIPCGALDGLKAIKEELIKLNFLK